MLQHLVAFGGLVFQEELIDDNCGVRLLAQPGHSLRQIFSPMSFVAGGLF